jgi:tetratricopeptide (TPR) repeat protein/tRNA A-37 threonylcarbamoyl transferase component Bud32
MLGSWVGPYEIIEKLGEGGMGQVYLAHDSRLHRRVALKTFASAKADSEEKAVRALQEAQAAANLKHPNIAAIHDIVVDGPRTSIIMEYVPGETLQALVARGPLSVDRAASLGAQLAGAVAHAHELGVIHRDLKPSNVIVTPAGQAKILDFGLAMSLSDGKLTPAQGQRVRLAGTPAYIAPELFAGAEPSALSDVYSLGVMLFEMLTASSPYGQHGVSWPDVLAGGTPPRASERNPEVPEAVAAVVARAMATDPRTRYQSAADLERDLRKLDRTLTSASISGRRTVAPPPRRWLLAALAAGTVALAVAALLVLRHQPSRAPLASIPAGAQDWFERGATALREGSYMTAAKRFEQAVALHDAFPLAHARLAEARAELDDDRARDSLLHVQELVPDLSALPRDDGLALEAIRAMVTRRFAEAAASYAQLAALHPNAAFAQVDVGRAQEANDELAAAARSYERASLLDPQSPAAFLGQGSIAGKRRELDSAVQAYGRAEALYQAASNAEGVAEVAYRRGALYDDVDRPKDAERELQRSLALARELGNAVQQARSLLRLASVRAAQGDTAAARTLAEDGMRLGRGMPVLLAGGLINLGNVSFQRGEYPEARRLFESALDSAGRMSNRRTEARALLSLASLDIQEGKAAAAQPRIERALPFYEGNGFRREAAMARQLLGQVSTARGDFAKAVAAFEAQLAAATALRDRSLEAGAQAQLAATLVRAERFADALGPAGAAIAYYEAHGALAERAESLLTQAQALLRLDRSADEPLQKLHAADLRALGGAGLESRVLAVDAERAAAGGRQAAAAGLYRRAIALALPEDAGEAVRLNLELAHALGPGRAGAQLAASALQWARQHRDDYLSAPLILRVAEYRARSGDAAGAYEAAVETQPDLVRTGRRVSAQRAAQLISQTALRPGKERKQP